MKFKFLFLLTLTSFLLNCSTERDAVVNGGWDNLDEILAKISPPSFPESIFDIKTYGAKDDGISDCLPAISKAIEECSSKGGGKVVVPSGEYFSKGSIHLKSNVNLYLAEGAVIKFSTNPKDYLPPVFTRWEGVECINYSPLIYAYEQMNLAVTGKGIFDGQASSENWWSWKGKSEDGWKEGLPSQNDPESRPRLMKMNDESTPVENRIFGDGYYLRPNFIQFYKCQNILLEGVTFKESPMWMIHPVLSENITIRNIKSISTGPNTDGCNPESCKNVLIENCFFSNGDDCIAIKSGRNADGRRISVPSENIIVRDCQMKNGHGGLVMGSEISGGCRNVFLENCQMDSPNLERAIRIKSNSYRGGIVENIYVRNVQVGEVKDAVIRMNMYYAPGEGNDGKHDPIFRNIEIKNVTSQKSRYAFRLEGLENSPIKNVTIEDCSFQGVKDDSIIKNVENIILRNVKVNDNQID